MLRYNKTVNATNSNKSGNNANIPRPNARNPKTHINIGLAVRAFKRKTNENMISPIVNCDRVLLYMSIYVVSRKIRSVTLSVERIRVRPELKDF